jgi:hypothetical protein
MQQYEAKRKENAPRVCLKHNVNGRKQQNNKLQKYVAPHRHK